ncbi:MAG: 23S rRNA (pseudouridine(1915)-N(3))-methyltransferase RlmH [Gammaproteobacteria bacterium]|nr:23S rRNA (pseudouridine(1915)-N(3))-methyltransferase RlmH [Gammaproteobacteria bacterium]
MRIHVLAVGTRLPAWQKQGFEEFARRLPRECALHLVEIPAPRRTRNMDAERAKVMEWERMRKALPRDTRVIALDEGGTMVDTATLAARLERWLDDGRDIALLVGGADGLAPAALAQAEARWSLSPLTLPHGLVRVLLAEQLYRAWSVIRGHPYHRE